MTKKNKKIKPVKLAVNLFEKAKLVKGDSVIELLQKSDYKGCPVYIRMIGGKVLEYLLVYEGEIYTGFNVITPKPGKKKLNKDEIAQCGELIFTGAITTIDVLMDKDNALAKGDDKNVN